MPDKATIARSTDQPRRPRKWGKWIAVLILSVLLGGLLFWLYYRKQIVREQLESAVWDGTDGLYQISYDEMRLDEWTGRIQFKNIQLNYDTSRYKSLRAENQAPPFLMRIKIPKLEINGVETPRALLSRQLKADEIQIHQPQVNWIAVEKSDTASSTFPSNEELVDVLGNLRWLRINRIQIHAGEFEKTRLGEIRDSMLLTGIYLRLDSIAIDSSEQFDAERMLFAKEIDLAVKQFNWRSSDGLYRCQIDSARIDSRAEQLQLARFRWQPVQNELDFMKGQRFATDRINAELRQLVLSGLQIPKMLRDSIMADSIGIGSGFVLLYRDLGLPHDGKNRVGTYPPQLLNKLGSVIDIPIVAGNNLLIEYKERNAENRKAGAVRFEQTSFEIMNLSNNGKPGDGNEPIQLNAVSRFMGVSNLNAKWKFNIEGKPELFSVAGVLGPMPRSSINKLIEPMGSARMEDGEVHSLQFNFLGNNHRMWGKLQLQYKDLRISLLQPAPDKKPSKKWLASLAANLFTRSSNMPDKGEPAEEYEVENERDPHRSIFHLIWKSIFEGIKTTMGR
ncbi:MAG: hypothetical protein ACK4E0_04680 [Chitinophagaceae bacterium]